MGKHKLNSLQVKENNKKMILRQLRMQGALRRGDLARSTDLTGATITNLIGELIGQGMVVEGTNGPSTGGRRPTFLHLNPDAGYFVGIELSSAAVTGVLTDFSPQVLHSFHYPIDFSEAPQRVIARIVASILALLEEHGTPSSAVFGVGIAAAGPYDRERDPMVNPPNFTGWQDVPLVQQVEAGCRIPTFFEKETSAIALAEYFFGARKGRRRILCVSVYEKGIGGGFVVDGNVYHGNRNVSMEIGHVCVEPEGLRCSCGDVGCLEVQADGQAALRYAAQAIAAGNSSELQRAPLDLLALAHAVRAGDPVATAAVERCARYLGSAITNIMMVLSPDILYLDGPFVRCCPALFSGAAQVIRTKNYPFPLATIEQETFSFGDFSGAMGGVAAAYAAVLS